ncbi:CRISPR/Cas system CSM-associated protein Csm3, group 7 of RAMP superfamily [Caldanaerovirga acetigignens]|uniref:CRISPR/Cas system CSM-associated protein Csm3, group 7 of RAMP superfamily n=1 Tax=Caldanaerovirga acetigignens TaxID=447595 RepID=A0A1M7MMX6_9FIRM|nr:RAMP superfamily CRISPR-associated protein [Caldanaerovirga acetigignens]SHM92269.1 CRISPR/Cas system CSM-associated protein Csm3, group 7 of RAMP superfamily [Caldanaerovirga acetigignens]
MSDALWAGKQSRKIISRIVVEGDLVLQTPAHFGNGDTDELVDMPLLVDPLDGRTPLLTGTSIAGALRSYLRERERGYGQSADGKSASVLLFGALKYNKNEEEGEQSPLIVEDALGKNFGIEIRNSVVIDPKSRTTWENRLFDLELWQAGTTFPLRFELVIREGDDEVRLKQALATALKGFNDGSITLGARKRRGYGRVRVPEWRVKRYDLTTPEGLLDWIENGDKPLEYVKPVSDIKTALGINELLPDRRQFFHLEATFSLDGSLLIRSGSGQDDRGPDIVHLHARQADGSIKPVLPGTSLAGALRARALRIVNTIANEDEAQKLVGEMFGPEVNNGGDPKSSRVIVSEAVINNARTDLVQNRVSIDRFTGGARETALFNEQPAFGGDDTVLTLELRLMNPQDKEIGLLLLLLKDLWTGDLPLGGEVGVGRGRLKGKRAVLTLQRDGGTQEWKIVANGRGLTIDGDRNELEQFVRALSN